jgi:hypothetical protein
MFKRGNVVGIMLVNSSEVYKRTGQVAADWFVTLQEGDKESLDRASDQFIARMIGFRVHFEKGAYIDDLFTAPSTCGLPHISEKIAALQERVANKSLLIFPELRVLMPVIVQGWVDFAINVFGAYISRTVNADEESAREDVVECAANEMDRVLRDMGDGHGSYVDTFFEDTDWVATELSKKTSRERLQHRLLALGGQYIEKGAGLEREMAEFEASQED